MNSSSNLFKSSRDQRPPFSDSQVATKAPKPNVSTPNFEVASSQTPLFEKIKQKLIGSKAVDASFDQKHEELEAEKFRQRQLAEKLNQLGNMVEAAQSRLARADAEFADLVERRATYFNKVKDMWGLPPNGFTGQAVPVERHYADTASCNAAIEDFPEARKKLVALVKLAEEKLSKFRRDSELDAD